MQITRAMDLGQLAELMGGTTADAHRMRDALLAADYDGTDSADIADADWDRLTDESVRLTFDTSRRDDHTHTVEDGAVRYYVAATGSAPEFIARQFMIGYNGDGSLVTFTVERLTDTGADWLGTFRGRPDTVPVAL